MGRPTLCFNQMQQQLQQLLACFRWQTNPDFSRIDVEILLLLYIKWTLFLPSWQRWVAWSAGKRICSIELLCSSALQMWRSCRMRCMEARWSYSMAKRLELHNRAGYMQRLGTSQQDLVVHRPWDADDSPWQGADRGKIIIYVELDSLWLLILKTYLPTALYS